MIYYNFTTHKLNDAKNIQEIDNINNLINYYNNGFNLGITRVEYTKDHDYFGMICYYDYGYQKGITRIECTKNYKKIFHEKGSIVYYDKGYEKRITRIEYTKDHDLFGQIIMIKDIKKV